MNHDDPRESNEQRPEHAAPTEGHRLRRHTADLYRESWDCEDLRRVVEKAAREGDMPRFHLDKVELHLAQTCNLACSFCYGKDVVPDESERQILDKETACRLLKDIRERMPETDPLIILAGLYSEPLLYPDIEEVVARLGEHGYRFGFYTNGLFMANRSKRKLIEVLAQSAMHTRVECPSYVSFNVTASMVSGNPDHLEVLLRAITELCQEIRETDSPLVVNASMHAIASRNDYVPIARRLSQIGVHNIRFSFPWAPQPTDESKSCGGLSKRRYESIAQRFERARQEMPEIVSIRYPPKQSFERCFVMTHAFSVSSEGDVFPCPEVCSSLFEMTHSYGSVYEDEISKLWGSERHRDRFLRLDPSVASCVCCHMDSVYNQVHARYWTLGSDEWQG